LANEHEGEAAFEVGPTGKRVGRGKRNKRKKGVGRQPLDNDN